MQAIKDINMGHIREGVRKYKDRVANKAQINADLNFLKWCAAAETNTTAGNVNLLTTGKAIHTQLMNTIIAQQPVHHVTQGDLFGGASSGGGNLFGTSTTSTSN